MKKNMIKGLGTENEHKLRRQKAMIDVAFNSLRIKGDWEARHRKKLRKNELKMSNNENIPQIH